MKPERKILGIAEKILMGSIPAKYEYLKIKKFAQGIDTESFINWTAKLVTALKISSGRYSDQQIFETALLFCKILDSRKKTAGFERQMAELKIEVYDMILISLNHMGSPDMNVYLDKFKTLLHRDYNVLNIGTKIDAQIIFGHHKASYSENNYDFSEATVKYLNDLVKKIQDLTLLGKNDSELGELLSHIANIYSFCGDIGMALFSFDLALKHYRHIPDEYYRTTTYKLETYFEGRAHILLDGSNSHTKFIKELLSEKIIKSFGRQLEIKYNFKELPVWCRDEQGKVNKYRLHLLIKMVAFDIYYSDYLNAEKKLRSEFTNFFIKFCGSFLKKSQGMHPEVCIAKWLGVIFALKNDMQSAGKYFVTAEKCLSTAPFTIKGFLPFLYITKAAMFARNEDGRQMNSAVSKALKIWGDIKGLGIVSKNYAKLYKDDFGLLKKKYKAGKLDETFLWKTANRLPYYFN